MQNIGHYEFWPQSLKNIKRNIYTYWYFTIKKVFTKVCKILVRTKKGAYNIHAFGKYLYYTKFLVGIKLIIFFWKKSWNRYQKICIN